MKKLLAIAAFVAATSSVAYADECSTTVYGKYGTKYQYQVLPVMGSDKPIFEGGTTLSCGKWWFDLWGAKDLSGHQSFGNEVDLTAAYDTSLFAGHWKVDVELYASYGAVPKFNRVKDDIVELYVDTSHTFTIGSATITPYVRPTQIIGLGVYANRLIIRSGAHFSAPITGRLSLSIDAAVSSEVIEDPKTKLLVQPTVTKRLVPTLRYDAGDGWSFSVDAKLADHLKPEFEFGFSKKF